MLRLNFVCNIHIFFILEPKRVEQSLSRTPYSYHRRIHGRTTQWLLKLRLEKGVGHFCSHFIGLSKSFDHA